MTVTNSGECWFHDTFGQFFKVNGPHALGSGADIARYCLAKGMNAVTCVRETYLTEVTCGGPVRFYDWRSGKMGEIPA